VLVEKKVKEAVRYLRRKGVRGASKGLLLESGMGGFSNELSRLTVIPQAKIPHFPRSLAPGWGGVLLSGDLGGREVVVQEGRAYLYEGYFHRELAFPLRVLGALGMRKLLLVTWVRTLDPEREASPMILVEDHLNLSGGSPLRGQVPGEGENFPLEMGGTHSVSLRKEARSLAREKGLPLDEVIMALVPGPENPTPAESRMLNRLGAHVFSTALAPEISMARFLGIEIAVLGLLHEPPHGRAGVPTGEGWDIVHLDFLRSLLESL
jgi:purine-nucleoside phosphorylase